MLLLAGLDVANETDCTGGGTHAAWDSGHGKVSMCTHAFYVHLLPLYVIAYSFTPCWHLEHPAASFMPAFHACEMWQGLHMHIRMSFSRQDSQYILQHHASPVPATWLELRCSPMQMPAHPQTWSRASDVTADLIDALRMPHYAKGGCNASAAIASAARAMPALGPTDASGSGAALALGDALSGVSNGVSTHFGELLRHMPASVQQLVGGMLAPLMRRQRRLQAAGIMTQRPHGGHGAALLRRRLQAEADGRAEQRMGGGTVAEVVDSSSVKPRALLSGAGGRTAPDPDAAAATNAWQGESWMLHDPYPLDDDGPAVSDLLQQYDALGHACPLFARKFVKGAAAGFAAVARQHILARP